MSNDQSNDKAALRAFATITGFLEAAETGRLNDAGKAALAEAEECLAALGGRGVINAYRKWVRAGRLTRGPEHDMLVHSTGGRVARELSTRPGRRW